MGESRGLGIEKLSAAQVETLQHVYAHRSSKEIARIMGVSPHTVDERLRRAIRILGVNSRIEAARLVAGEVQPSTYQPLIYQSSELVEGRIAADEQAAPAGRVELGALSIGYPFPTRARPTNTHGLRERILWPILIAFGTIMAFAALYAVLLGLGAMLT
ncbi:helix-turn-helix transcriptional regulator [Sphingorhabdus sp.]|uniref:response regulator transcription factor n=1 Tax=Sphingorhabdus sp. TaxID=1902408 RepID=UPI002C659509|nr:helix-turn-helix transcriptional regulator [Sphingorhabdus sp.]HMT40639.1 helix-turn-helix transcriptional regulator [Sphingorhabdus sp.]